VTESVIEECEARRGEATNPLLLSCFVENAPPFARRSFGMLGESVEETRITLTGGRMVIHSPAHCPTRVTVREKNPGRGEKGSEETFEFELPPQSDEIYQAGGYYYPNSTGLLYEAIAISKYISEGKLESDDYTLNETLTCMRILDEARKQFDE